MRRDGLVKSFTAQKRIEARTADRFAALWQARHTRH
jgi:hypothetical protein